MGGSVRSCGLKQSSSDIQGGTLGRILQMDSDLFGFLLFFFLVAGPVAGESAMHGLFCSLSQVLSHQRVFEPEHVCLISSNPLEPL